MISKNVAIAFLLALIALTSPTSFATTAKPGLYGADPTDYADIVGRNLAPPVTGLPALAGHVGIYVSGGSVIEVTNTTGNAVNVIALSEFKSASQYWGASYFPVDLNASTGLNCAAWSDCSIRNVVIALKPVPVCADVACSSLVPVSRKFAIARRAYLVYQIGADYTYSPYFHAARPSGYTNEGRYVPPTRGKYRCDSFIRDLFSVTFLSSIDPSRAVSDAPKLTRDDETYTPDNVVSCAAMRQWVDNEYSFYFAKVVLPTATPITLFNTFTARGTEPPPFGRKPTPQNPPRGSSS